ncbi:signal peptidase I [Brevibacillus sp. 7WMA2]|uniref:signal peptidase I n=1 Tax=Brevibacillus TaxID=55080 RepID=UPI000EAECA98|nr:MULTISPECIES: signal peptidase I [Brevibacillus]AYK06414.1 signal peptidase I [Brevibacillus laterosporus]QIC07286.1 signal peptidase I [Brevibacillus sp. 7WMA2]
MNQTEPRSGWGRAIKEWLTSIITVFIVTFALYTWLGAPYVVYGESMQSTLQNNEKVVVNKAVYRLHEPQRGEIVVFHANQKEDYIKRVIAIAGDRVEMRNDQLFINGKPVEEPYLEEQKKKAHAEGKKVTEDFPPVTVEAGYMFVMGDNRQNSKDSRMIGPVPITQVVGRADFVYWPLSNVRSP